MRIELITPSPSGVSDGNRITAVRWARILRSLGHRVSINTEWSGHAVDALISLHAVKSFRSARAFRKAYPAAPLIVCATGTDLSCSEQLERGLADATRIVVLQPHALTTLPAQLRKRSVVIRQSAGPPPRPVPRVTRHVQLAVVANLRPVKDPLRPALAARELDEDSRIHVVLAGAALKDTLATRASSEAASNERFSWRGALPPGRARRLIAASQAVVIPSRQEGGSNVLCEALAARTPILASDTPGLLGTLGADYPGLFPVGDTAALRDRMSALETDRAFGRALGKACKALRPLVDPKRERTAWSKLMRDIA